MPSKRRDKEQTLSQDCKEQTLSQDGWAARAVAAGAGCVSPGPSGRRVHALS